MMFYTGLMAISALIVSFIWLVTTLFTSQSKRYPLIALSLSILGLSLAFLVTPKAPSTLLPQPTLSANITSVSQMKEKLAQAFKTQQSDLVPYAKAASISFYENGTIRHIQLDVTDQWHTLTTAQKQQYITFLKKLSRSVQKEGPMPFMQIHGPNEVVARSGAQHTESIHLFK